MKINADQTVYYVDYQAGGFPVVAVKYRDFLYECVNGIITYSVPHETMTGAELERLEALDKREEEK